MKKKILFLAANPTNTGRLRLDEEVREIEEALKLAKLRDQFEIESKWAVRTEDLRRALLEHEPQIVHFSGHGSGEGGLALEDELGKAKLVSASALTGLFRLFESIECVFLNACYSQIQAEAIHQHINYVIGMNQAIGDRAAIQFAKGFYDALGVGKGYEYCFKMGCASIDLEGIPESKTPVLKTSAQRASSMACGSEELDFYIERHPIEKNCRKYILQAGSLLRIKAQKQMGKTSLMHWTLRQAKQQGYQTVYWNLRQLSESVIQDLEQLLKSLCVSVSRQMKLENQIDEFWGGSSGSNLLCSYYFEDYILPEAETALVLGIDNVDRVFLHEEIAADFLGLLRSWYESSSSIEIWQKLRLLIAYSTEDYPRLSHNTSPFNVGTFVEIPEFSLEQVQQLGQQLDSRLNASQVEELMAMVGGHPYLLREAFDSLQSHPDLTLEAVLKNAPTNAGIYYNYLGKLCETLKQEPALAEGMKRAIDAPEPIRVEDSVAFRLDSLGLIRKLGDQIEPRCQLYQLYFKDRLSIMS